MKDLRKPVIEYELVDGKERVLHYFASSKEVTRYYQQADPPLNIWQSLVSNCCRGIVKWAKKHRFRFATPEEVATMEASIKMIAESKKKQLTQEIPTQLEDVQHADIENIPAVTEKPASDDGLTPFERLLQKMRRE